MCVCVRACYSMLDCTRTNRSCIVDVQTSLHSFDVGLRFAFMLLCACITRDYVCVCVCVYACLLAVVMKTWELPGDM